MKFSLSYINKSNNIFNIGVKETPSHTLGRVAAKSTFHHFCDYHWDAKIGCPSFVEESPGDGMQTEPRALEDLITYIRNIVLWLAT